MKIRRKFYTSLVCESSPTKPNFFPTCVWESFYLESSQYLNDGLHDNYFYSSVQKRERSALHEKSRELVKGWENTIEGQRLKKLQARNIREEQEEKERQKIDIEEAKLQGICLSITPHYPHKKLCWVGFVWVNEIGVSGSCWLGGEHGTAWWPLLK